jgi:hypothetical protein
MLQDLEKQNRIIQQKNQKRPSRRFGYRSECDGISGARPRAQQRSPDKLPHQRPKESFGKCSRGTKPDLLRSFERLDDRKAQSGNDEESRASRKLTKNIQYCIILSIIGY